MKGRSILPAQLFSVLVSAICLILSFPPYNVTLLAWAGFIPLLFALDRVGPAAAFLISYLAGVIFFLGTIWWLAHVTLPGMIIVVLYLALYFGAFGVIASSVLRKPVRGGMFLCLPAIWVALEYLRSSGSAGFGWALLAHSQSYALPVIQIADVTGAYGVSFLIVLVNVTLFLTVKNFRNPRSFIAPLIITTLILYIALAYGHFRMKSIFTGEGVRIAVVQGNIPQHKKWDSAFRGEILARYAALTQEACKENADLVIWPETSVPGFLETDRILMEELKSLARKTKTHMLVGAPRESGGAEEKYYNSAFLLSDEGRVIDHYDKLHLVPFGEYIPLKRVFSFVDKFAPMPIGDFTAGDSYKVFRFFIEKKASAEKGIWRLIKKVSFSCLICFEDIFPDLARNFVKEDAAFLVNITNDAWFGFSSAPYQHAENSVFRAVENRVNVVRSANTGLSCFIDQKGQISETVGKEKGEIFVEGFAVRDIILTPTRTFYTAYGDIFAFGCVLLAFYPCTRKPRV